MLDNFRKKKNIVWVLREILCFVLFCFAVSFDLLAWYSIFSYDECINFILKKEKEKKMFHIFMLFPWHWKWCNGFVVMKCQVNSISRIFISKMCLFEHKGITVSHYRLFLMSGSSFREIYIKGKLLGNITFTF